MTTSSAHHQSPLLVTTTRGGLVETTHPVSYVVVDSDGVRDRAGDIDSPVFGRSSTKPLQTVPLLTSGAADAYELDTRHLALAAGSHNGEDIHVDLVSDWLESIDCAESDLECGVMAPFLTFRDRELAVAGIAPDQRHHMCSGKHAGFLTLARHIGAPTAGYIDVDHPVQQLVTETIATLTGADAAVGVNPVGVDGCGVPTISTSLLGLAQAALGFAPDLGTAESPESTGPGERDVAAACRLVGNAMAQHPELVAGRDRLCTQAMRAARGQLAIKTGAAGVFFAAARPEGEQPFAVALKVHDGNTPAAEVAILHVLATQGLDLRDADPALAARHVLSNIAGTIVGSREAVAPVL